MKVMQRLIISEVRACWMSDTAVLEFWWPGWMCLESINLIMSSTFGGNLISCFCLVFDLLERDVPRVMDHPSTFVLGYSIWV